jgi:hypothetical protein
MPDHPHFIFESLNGEIDFYELCSQECTINVIRQILLNHMAAFVLCSETTEVIRQILFSVTPALNEAEAELISFSQNGLLYKILGQNIKHTLH